MSSLGHSFSKAIKILYVSQIYGYMAIVGCLFLATLCVIKEVGIPGSLDLLRAIANNAVQRQEEERYKKIDSKRGFV